MKYYIIDTSTQKLKFEVPEDYSFINDGESLIVTEIEYLGGMYSPVWNGEHFVEGMSFDEIDGLKTCEALRNEKTAILQWFAETDYIVLKVFRGNWTEDDVRYQEYLKNYEQKKSRYDEVEHLLGLKED